MLLNTAASLRTQLLTPLGSPYFVHSHLVTHDSDEFAQPTTLYAKASPKQPKTVTKQMAIQRQTSGARQHEASHMSGIGENVPKHENSQVFVVLGFLISIYVLIFLLKPAIFWGEGGIVDSARWYTQHNKTCFPRLG